LLHCNVHIAAMQIKSLYLASGIPKSDAETARRSLPYPEIELRSKMSKTAALPLSPSATLLGRLLAAIDRWLLTYAELQIRNGDVPRVGL
jgi:hypothetical protein